MQRELMDWWMSQSLGGQADILRQEGILCEPKMLNLTAADHDKLWWTLYVMNYELLYDELWWSMVGSSKEISNMNWHGTRTAVQLRKNAQLPWSGSWWIQGWWQKVLLPCSGALSLRDVWALPSRLLSARLGKWKTWQATITRLGTSMKWGENYLWRDEST